MSADLPSLVSRLEAVATRLEYVASGGGGQAGLKPLRRISFLMNLTLMVFLKKLNTIFLFLIFVRC